MLPDSVEGSQVFWQPIQMWFNPWTDFLYSESIPIPHPRITQPQFLLWCLGHNSVLLNWWWTVKFNISSVQTNNFELACLSHSPHNNLGFSESSSHLCTVGSHICTGVPLLSLRIIQNWNVSLKILLFCQPAFRRTAWLGCKFTLPGWIKSCYFYHVVPAQEFNNIWFVFYVSGQEKKCCQFTWNHPKCDTINSRKLPILQNTRVTIPKIIQTNIWNPTVLKTNKQTNIYIKKILLLFDSSNL